MSKKQPVERHFFSKNLADELRDLIKGQHDVIQAIVPYVQVYEAGLAPEGRPVGVFYLMSPTGTGKTRTAEALAQVLHGNEGAMLKISCQEFQMEHEIAKLIGAPPGYLGHRETQPQLNQARLNAVTSLNCPLSIVLFDEIEKAAPSLHALILGILDKGMLRLGDNSNVNFQRSLVFITSNVGAREMENALRPTFGYNPGCQNPLQKNLKAIGMRAIRRKYTPEFINRVDMFLTYSPLTREVIEEIFELEMLRIIHRVKNETNSPGFDLEFDPEATKFLITRGFSVQYGARELKRVIHRFVVQPIALIRIHQTTSLNGPIKVQVSDDGESLVFYSAAKTRSSGSWY